VFEVSGWTAERVVIVEVHEYGEKKGREMEFKISREAYSKYFKFELPIWWICRYLIYSILINKSKICPMA
jgi:hypothetical protein